MDTRGPDAHRLLDARNVDVEPHAALPDNQAAVLRGPGLAGDLRVAGCGRAADGEVEEPWAAVVAVDAQLPLEGVVLVAAEQLVVAGEQVAGQRLDGGRAVAGDPVAAAVAEELVASQPRCVRARPPIAVTPVRPPPYSTSLPERMVSLPVPPSSRR